MPHPLVKPIFQPAAQEARVNYRPAVGQPAASDGRVGYPPCLYIHEDTNEIRTKNDNWLVCGQHPCQQCHMFDVSIGDGVIDLWVFSAQSLKALGTNPTVQSSSTQRPLKI